MPQLSVCFNFLSAPDIVAVFVFPIEPIDFLVFGFIVIGGAYGLFFNSFVDGCYEFANTELIYYYVKYLL